MASQASPTATKANNKYESFVDHQLEKTRARIKMVDLCTGVFALVAWVLGVLLFFAIVDSWIWTLGTFGRSLALFILVGGFLGISIFYVLPLFLRKINPKYAAQMIEQARPKFKNSILNYLWVKTSGKSIHNSVATELSQQAAEDISEVSANESVDQSNLIRAGFIVVGLSVLAVGYSVFSPKNPLPTVARVINPFSDIAKPAMVRIASVEPGNAEVFFGDSLSVTAELRGRHEPSDVQLVYSTDDGQHTDVALPMVVNGPRRYQLNLQTSATGIQQDLKYKIVARDGESQTFQVKVKPLPAVSIQTLKLVPPKYTELAERTITGTGEANGIEGTRVFLDALANMPVKSAYLEFLSPTNGDKEDLRVVKTAELDFEGQQISGSFLLTLNAERTEPFCTHYQIRYQSTGGELNSKPNLYPVRVTPDLAPELSFIEPRNNEILVPANGSLKIQIEATDVDYEISSLKLQVDNKNIRILNHEFALPEGDKHRVTQSYWLVPEKLSLVPGDTATFFAVAADNRHSPYSDLLDPNITRTENFTIKVTEPDEQIDEQQRDKDIEQSEKEQQQKNDGETSEQNEQDSSSDQPKEQEQSQSDTGDSGNDPESGEQQDGNSQEPQDGNSSPQEQAGGGEGSENEQTQEQTGDQSQEGSESGNSQTGEPQESQEQQSNAQDQSQSESGSSDSNANQQPQQSNGSQNNQNNNSEQQQNSSGSSKSEPSNQGDPNNDSQSNEGQPNDGSANNSQSGDNTNGQQSNGEGEGSKDENLQDGEMSQDTPEGDRIEDMMEYFDEKGKDNPDSGDGQESNSETGDPSDDGTGDQTGEPGDAESGDQDPSGERPEEGNGQGSQDKNRDTENEGEQQGSGGNSEENPDNKGNANQEENSQPKGDGSESEQMSNAENEGQNSDGDSNSENESSSQSREDQSSGDSEKNQDGGTGEGESKDGENGNQAEQSDSKGEPEGTGGQEDPSGEKGDGEKGKGDNSQEEPSSDSNSGEKSNEGGSNNQSSGDPPTGEGESEKDNNRPSEQSQSGSGGSKGSDGNANDFGDEADEKTFNPNNNPNAPIQSERDFERAEQEKANIEHAKKATDLLLENLRAQSKNPDPEFLERNNWTPEELEQFIKSWEKMRDAAKKGGLKEKRLYESRLKSLGLKPQNVQSRDVQGERDQKFGLSEDGAVNRPSADWSERYNRYMKQRNRVDRD